jgi:uncharacterized protein (TIGR00369 family)
MTGSIDKRIRTSFDKQTLMATLGANIEDVQSGRVSIRAPLAPHVLQQHGFGHAGLTFAIGDSAAGYSALTLFDPETEVLTAEIKINLLAPAKGEFLIARGRVIKLGRRLCVVASDIFAYDAGKETLIAIMQGTMVPV